MFNPFKRKPDADEDPPDEIKGKVEFCSPTLPSEIFDKSESLDKFINNLNKENEQRS